MTPTRLPTTGDIVEAIQRSAVEAARNQIEKVVFPLERIENVFSRAHQEADRSASILLFALCEDLIQDAFKSHLHEPPSGGWDDVTGGNGLLATANDRFMLAALLGWLPPSVYSDMRTLKAIRNRFAHHADVVNFEDNTIRSWISNISASEKPIITKFSQLMRQGKFTPRQIFFIRSALVITTMVEVLTLAPVARSQRVSPSKIYPEEWENLLNNIKSLRNLAADQILRAC